MKVTVVVNGEGQIVAAHIPVTPEGRPDTDPGSGAMVSLAAPDGHDVMVLDVPDEDAPGHPPDDLLERLQRHKDAAG